MTSNVPCDLDWWVLSNSIVSNSLHPLCLPCANLSTCLDLSSCYETDKRILAAPLHCVLLGSAHPLPPRDSCIQLHSRTAWRALKNS